MTKHADMANNLMKEIRKERIVRIRVMSDILS